MSLGAEIRARMSLDASGVKAGVAQAKGHVDGFKGSLGGLAGKLGLAFGAGAAVAAITNFTKASIEMAGRTADMAEQTGLTVEQLQAFQASAMEMTGGMKAAEVGLVAFRSAQDEALEGNKTTIAAFQKLGISLEDIANKSTPQLLEAVAKGYKSVGDFGALVDIFGKVKAAKLEGALIALADNGFGGMIKKADEAGLVLEDDLVAQLDQVGDAMDRLGIRSKNMWDRFMVHAYNAGRVVWNYLQAFKEGASSMVTDLLDPGKAFTGAEIWQRASQANYNTFNEYQAEDRNDDKMFRQKLAQERQKSEEQNAALRKGKIGEIYAAEAEEAKKVEDKKAEETAKALEKKLAAEQKASEKLAEKAAADAGVSVTELRGAGTKQFQQRFDSLRQIGANVLGSGVIRPAAVDREAEIARATQATADNTARLVQKLDAPPISRLASSAPVY